MKQELRVNPQVTLHMTRYPRTFEATFDGRRDLGIRSERSGPGELKIVQVLAQGAISISNHQWVVQRKYHRVIKRGMFIVKVNETSEAHLMESELRKAQQLTLLVRRGRDTSEARNFDDCFVQTLHYIRDLGVCWGWRWRPDHPGSAANSD
ncbi:unnamed protein product [Symbiodinium sp. CCMP2592]|nr:unnamed protein product [Symbiodinium sp. CCMP2592]